MVAAATLEAPLRRRDRPGAARVACAPVSPAALALTGGCLGLWVLAACGTASWDALLAPGGSGRPTVWKSIGQKVPELVRDPRWDRARFHLMTVIIWSHWVGKWGLQTTKAGWVVLNWAFAVHVIGFIFLSGAFSTRYAMKVQERGWKECVPVLWNCLDVFLVYLTFSWLRGVVSISMDSSHPSAHWIMTQTLKGTFAFHQAPWYLSALIMWRLSAFLHWRVPGMLVLSLLIGALCPYEALNKAHDPFAIREVMHYLPFFTLGILCGQERLEQMIDLCGKWRAVVGLVVLAGLAAVICIPLGPMFDDPTLRWVLLKKVDASRSRIRPMWRSWKFPPRPQPDRDVFNAGLDCFDLEVGDQLDNARQVDAEATDDYHKQVKLTRVKKTIEYYNSAQSMMELPILTVLVGIYDFHLLHPMLGDPVKASDGDEVPKKTPKLDKLLSKETSLIGQCSGKLLVSMKAWRRGGGDRGPWRVLDMMRVRVEDPGVMRFAWSQTLRLAGAVFRRYETKCSSKPYDMHILSISGATSAEKAPCIDRLMAADDDDLDLHSRGVRQLFVTKSALEPVECRSLSRADFATHAFSTDAIERPKKKAVSSTMEEAVHSPLVGLLRAQQHGNDGQREQPEAASTDAPALVSSPAAAARGGAPIGGVEVGGAVVPSGERRGLFDDACSRAVSECMDLLPTESPMMDHYRRSGLNPYFLGKNKWMHAAADLKGSALADGEIERATEDFKQLWGSVVDTDVYEEARALWVQQMAAKERDEGEPNRFVQQWGYGSVVSPITSAEFCEHIRDTEGWPPDADITDVNNQQSRVTADLSVNFDAAKGGGGEGKFKIVQRGFEHVLSQMQRDRVESADVMFMVEGTTMQDKGGFSRLLIQVIGSCFNPVVFDFARHQSERATLAHEKPLTFPCRAFVEERPCRVSDKFMAAHAQTSDEFVRERCKLFSFMELFDVEWDPVDVDGTLLRVELKSATSLGCLWKAGLTKALGAKSAQRDCATASSFTKMKTDDPPNPAPKPVPKPKAKGTPRAAGRPSEGKAVLVDDEMDMVEDEEMDIARGDGMDELLLTWELWEEVTEPSESGYLYLGLRQAVGQQHAVPRCAYDALAAKYRIKTAANIMLRRRMRKYEQELKNLRHVMTTKSTRIHAMVTAPFFSCPCQLHRAVARPEWLTDFDARLRRRVVQLIRDRAGGHPS
ncbi:unnamed protein product [Prorocentrum cordatum]|uniref:Uncharacterized protein n=1 Tax=Prorocentrum cordatum TaxID=2364126 RepID=A0ABN9WES8_9DINO|nr:unnamed protein product [Polarella glacialis]